MKTNLVRSFGFLALSAVGACSSATEAPQLGVPKFTCVSNSATMRLPADLRATLPAWGMRRPDDAYVSISQSVPGGFAGIFFEDGHYVLTFVDPATANQARPEIQQAFTNRGFASVDVATAEFRAARWTFAELDEWYRYIIPRLPGASWNSSDIDEKANTLSFGVLNETERGQLEAQLSSLGVSCNLVTTRIQPPAIIELN